MSANTKKDPRFVTTMFPLISTQGQIGFDSVQRDEQRKLINSHLKMLMLTNPGEIISDSQFGVGLYTHLFLLENEKKIIDLQQTIVDQINNYLPYLTDYTVTVDTTKITEHKIAVRIVYIITQELARETIDFIVSDGTTVVIADDSGGSTTVTLGDILSERV